MVGRLVGQDRFGVKLSEMVLNDIQAGWAGAPVMFPRIFAIVRQHAQRNTYPMAGLGQFDWGGLISSVITAGSTFASNMLSAQTQTSIAKLQVSAQAAEAERQRQAALEAARIQAQMAAAVQPKPTIAGVPTTQTAVIPSTGFTLPNWAPWAIGGGLGLAALFMFMRRKKR